jgi:hypothetical protein
MRQSPAICCDVGQARGQRAVYVAAELGADGPPQLVKGAPVSGGFNSRLRSNRACSLEPQSRRCFQATVLQVARRYGSRTFESPDSDHFCSSNRHQSGISFGGPERVSLSAEGPMFEKKPCPLPDHLRRPYRPADPDMRLAILRCLCPGARLDSAPARA